MATVGPAMPPGSAGSAQAGGAARNPHQNRAVSVTGIRCAAPRPPPPRAPPALLAGARARRRQSAPRLLGLVARQDEKGPEAHVRHSQWFAWPPRSPMVDEALLGEIFGAFGELTTCKIVRDSAGVKGFCEFVDYTSAR